MDQSRDTTARAMAGACLAAVFLACMMTFPLIAAPGRLGRTTTMDGLYSIWNVAWVARTLVTRPLTLFDANIFYPHRNTLAYSEANVVAGVVGIPAWVFTHNAYAAHSSAVLFAFASTFIGMWLLARHLSGSHASALVAAILFAFCPYFYSCTTWSSSGPVDSRDRWTTPRGTRRPGKAIWLRPRTRTNQSSCSRVRLAGGSVRCCSRARSLSSWVRSDWLPV
jgi:hypothetical protein